MLLPLQLPNVDEEKIAHADSLTKANVEQKIDSLIHSSPQEIVTTLLHGALNVLIKIVIVIAIWYIGRWLIRKLSKLLNNIFERRHVDSSLRTFVNNLITISLTIILVYIIIGVLGLNTSSFIALFASAGLAIGLALSGTLQNFAGGVMLLLLKPYHVGDLIEAQGYTGTVRSIQLFNTILTTSDNQTIIIPNGPLSTGSIKNVSKEPTRRVEWIIGINYGDDFNKAREIIRGILDKESRIIKDKGYTIEINELAASSVNIVIRVWVKAADYWDVFYNMNEQFYAVLPASGIVFPYSQMDVHIINPNDTPSA